jgi:hypothetical protein
LFVALRAQLSEEVSVTLVEGLLLSWVTMTMITSLLRQFAKTTLTVVAGDWELALAKQSRPLTKLAVTVPPALTVSIVLDDEILLKVIPVVLDVQAVKV